MSRHRPLTASAGVKAPDAYHSYLVRLWQDGTHGPWRASAYSIQTGVTHRFANLEALYAFLDAQAGERSA